MPSPFSEDMSRAESKDTATRKVAADHTLPCLLFGCTWSIAAEAGGGMATLYRQKVFGPRRVTGPYGTQRPGWATSAALVLHEEGSGLTLPLLAMIDCFNCNLG